VVTCRVALPGPGNAQIQPIMKRAYIPLGIALALVGGVLLSLPLRDSLVVLSVAAFVASLTVLAWWVLWADRGAPPAQPRKEVEYLDDWDSFERAFWAHVSEHETTSDLD
jgi:hypothetical protein